MKSSFLSVNMRKVLSLLAMLLLAGGSMCRADTGTVAAVKQEVPPKQGDEMAVDIGGGVKMEFAWIPPGEFDMGSNDGYNDEKPVHRVKIGKGFWMGKYEVTQEQWQQVVGSNPSKFKGAKNPVENVSWDDCQGFVQKLNGRLSSLNARLPTEAEWEYACRAGTTTRFSVGNSDDDLGRAAWYLANSGDTTHPVGEKAANGFGLYDMHGNVWEWCEDWYGNYESVGVTDPKGLSSGSLRVLRGGSWGAYPLRCRSSSRLRNAPACRGDVGGFRVVAVP